MSEQNPSPPAPPTPAMLAANPAGALDLTPQQQQQVEHVFARRQETMLDLLSRLRNELQANLDAVAGDINQILTPEQRTRFGVMMSKMRERAQRDSLGPPFPPTP